MNHFRVPGSRAGRLPRRLVLRGAGAAITLPLLDAMLPRAAAAPSTFEPLAACGAVQPRLLCCYVPNGVNILEWVPADAGAGYALSPTLETLAPYRDDFTVISGLGHPHAKGGHSGADTWLTGADLAAKPGADYTNTVSIDQLVAGVHGPHTRYASLQLADRDGVGVVRAGLRGEVGTGQPGVGTGVTSLRVRMTEPG
ncbi:MAG: DUF1552 domain-containing protein, partial [Planctomycetia bacterium]